MLGTATNLNQAGDGNETLEPASGQAVQKKKEEGCRFNGME